MGSGIRGKLIGGYVLDWFLVLDYMASLHGLLGPIPEINSRVNLRIEVLCLICWGHLYTDAEDSDLEKQTSNKPIAQ